MTEPMVNPDSFTTIKEKDLAAVAQTLEAILRDRLVRITSHAVTPSGHTMRSAPPAAIDGYFNLVGARRAQRITDGHPQNAVEVYDIEDQVLVTIFPGYGITPVVDHQFWVKRPTRSDVVHFNGARNR